MVVQKPTGTPRQSPKNAATAPGRAALPFVMKVLDWLRIKSAGELLLYAISVASLVVSVQQAWTGGRLDQFAFFLTCIFFVLATVLGFKKYYDEAYQAKIVHLHEDIQPALHLAGLSGLFQPPGQSFVDDSAVRRFMLNDGTPLRAIHSCLGAWGLRISKCRAVSDSVLAGVWEQFLATYFLEESFDVGRGEFVTNGRNYPFLMLAITEAFVKSLRAGDKLHMCVFTPVLPHDWVNWPHGPTKPYAHYENSFIATFYRLLANYLAEPAATGRIQLCRYVLWNSASRSSMGTLVPSRSQLEKASKWRMIPLPVHLDDIRSEKGLELLYGYFADRIKDAYGIGDDQLRKFIDKERPVVVPAWDTEDTKSPYTKWLEALDSDGIKRLKSIATRHLEDRIRDTLRELTDALKRFEEDSEWTDRLESWTKHPESLRVFEAIHLLQRIDAAISSYVDVDNVWSWCLLEHVYQLQAVRAVSGPMNISDWFVRTLHSKIASTSEREAHHAYSLNLADLQEFFEDNDLGAEFCVWGIEHGGVTNWKLELSASMQLPFDTTRIRVKHDVPDGDAPQHLGGSELLAAALTGLGSDVVNWSDLLPKGKSYSDFTKTARCAVSVLETGR